MKTTIEIADVLLKEARRVARREKTTVRAVVETGLRQVLVRHSAPKPFHLRRASFKGRGVQKGVSEGAWSEIRALIYEGRGS